MLSYNHDTSTVKIWYILPLTQLWTQIKTKYNYRNTNKQINKNIQEINYLFLLKMKYVFKTKTYFKNKTHFKNKIYFKNKPNIKLSI